MCLCDLRTLGHALWRPLEGNGQNLPLLALVDDFIEEELPVHADNDVRRSDDTLLVGLVAVPLPCQIQNQRMSIFAALLTKKKQNTTAKPRT